MEATFDYLLYHEWCQGLGVGEGELVSNGDRASAWEDVNVLQMDGGDGCTTRECT